MANYENYTGRQKQEKRAAAPGRYVYTPPSNAEKEKQWEQESLERQRAERVEAAAAVNRNPVAPPPNPVYNNPVGSAAALNRSEAKINPYVNPTKPAYQGAAASGELSKPTPQAEFRYEPAPKNGFDPPTNNIPYGMYGSTAQDPWGTTSTYNNWNLPKENPNPPAPQVRPVIPTGSLPPEGAGNFGSPATYKYVPPVLPGANRIHDVLGKWNNDSGVPYGEFGSTAYDPWGTLTPYQYAKLSVPQPQGPQMSGMGLYGTGINTLVANANKQAQVNERLRQWFMLNPNATPAQYDAMKKSLVTSLSSGSSYQGAMASGELAPATRQTIPLTGSLPPEGAGAFLKKNDLLSAAVTPQSPIYNYPAYPNLPLMYQDRYNFAQKMANLPPVYQYPKTMLDGTTKGTVPDENKALDSESGSGRGAGSYLPWKPEGYTEDELRAKGHKFVGVYEFYDTNAKYWDKKNAKSDGMNRYAGFYVWNGKYYPINQPKAQYAISKGIGGLGEADFNNPNKTSRFYEGYSKDVENFIRNFGPENLWRYDPNWKNAGLKYSNPTTSHAPVWNTGNSGGSGRMQSDDPRNRGWYFNPAVNWAT